MSSFNSSLVAYYAIISIVYLLLLIISFSIPHLY
nr:MAG TPA: hypothetical protein [Caudoviricetes sp.]DAJ11784.1 MAG TPA: hypothetical protein [Caudoviricetes sp.]